MSRLVMAIGILLVILWALVAEDVWRWLVGRP
jgi:hypothetical protein